MARRRPRSAGLVLLLAALAGCGPANVSDATTAETSAASQPTTTATDEASDRCSEHFDDVRLSELSVVAMVRQLGPQLIDPPPGPLDPYSDEEPVALCLVPNSEGTFDVFALVLADDATFLRWRQNLDDQFYWPV